MNKINNFITLIVIIFYAPLIQSDEDLIELSCTKEAECKQFEDSDIKSFCIEDQCRCTSLTGASIKCQPLNLKVNNMIGGSGPCTIRNSDTDKKQNICYCIRDYLPSRDKRRCIPKTVALNEKCEEDRQCQQADFNAVCHESKQCKCMDQFVSDDGVCVSVLGNQSPALNDTKCLQQFGANTRYSPQNQHCVCSRGHFASIDNTKCLKIAKHLENCTENLQCIGAMGPGGKCIENVCKCAEKYFVEEMKNHEGVVKSVCNAVVERGQYCRYDDDCYQRQLSKAEQSMHCSYAECNCKDGFNSLNEGACIQGSGAGGLKSFMNFHHIIFILFAIAMF